MTVIRGDSPRNPAKAPSAVRLDREASHIVAVTTVVSAVLVLLLALSLVVFVPADTALTFGIVLAAIGSFLAVFRLLARMRSNRVRISLVGRVPLGAGVVGDDFTGLLTSASRPVRRWCLGCAAAAVVIMLAAGGPQDFFPNGHGEKRGDRYVETEHAYVVRSLTRDEFVAMRMRELRFFLTGGLAFVLVTALMASGARRTELG